MLLHRVIYENEKGQTKATHRMDLTSALEFQEALKVVRGCEVAEVVTLVTEQLRARAYADRVGFMVLMTYQKQKTETEKIKMHRVTFNELLKKVDWLNSKMDKEPREKGAYSLYKDGSGYELHLIVNDGGGVRQIGYYRKTAREMYFFLDGIIEGYRMRESIADFQQA